VPARSRKLNRSQAGNPPWALVFPLLHRGCIRPRLIFIPDARTVVPGCKSRSPLPAPSHVGRWRCLLWEKEYRGCPGRGPPPETGFPGVFLVFLSILYRGLGPGVFVRLKAGTMRPKANPNSGPGEKACLVRNFAPAPATAEVRPPYGPLQPRNNPNPVTRCFVRPSWAGVASEFPNLTSGLVVEKAHKSPPCPDLDRGPPQMSPPRRPPCYFRRPVPAPAPHTVPPNRMYFPETESRRFVCWPSLRCFFMWRARPRHIAVSPYGDRPNQINQRANSGPSEPQLFCFFVRQSWSAWKVPPRRSSPKTPWAKPLNACPCFILRMF